MKFLEKHKKFISRVLVVTVSLMLLLSSLPVGASSVSTAGYDKVQCTFSKVSVYGVDYNAGNKDRFKMDFSNEYGSYGDGSFYFFLTNPVSINAGNAARKGISFVLYFPYVLKTTGEKFKISFDTNLGKSFSLNISAGSIVGNFQHVGGDFGQIIKLNTFVDYSRIVAMHEYAGNFKITGIRVELSGGAGQILGNGNYIAISDFYDCTVSVVEESGTSEGQFIVNAFRPLLQALGDGIATALNVLGNEILVPVLNYLGDCLTVISNMLSPLLRSVLEDVVLPVLTSLFDVLSNLSITLANAFLPIISGIIKDFTPFFNQLFNQLTLEFIGLSSDISLALNKFIQDISPSFDSIVENTSKNIRLIVEECFIPDNSSEQVQEFLSIKNDLTNKVPIFTQLSSFLETLFNPDTYYSSSSVIEKTYLDIGFIRNYYRFNKPLKAGDYKLVFNCHTSASLSGYPDLTLQAYDNVKKKWINIFSYSNYVRSGNVVYFSISNLNDYEIYELKLLHAYGIHETTLYSLDNTILSSNVVNYKGTPINAFNFDWYKPYKKYGDICIIAFCYLVFIWRTFKRLPILI